MPIDGNHFHESFFEEVAENLERLEELVVAIEGAAPTREDFDALFRVAHSIKGASGTFGFREMADLTHYLESVLQRVREGSLLVCTEVVDAVLLTGDVLTRQLCAYRMKEAPDDQQAAAARMALQHVLDSQEAPAQAHAAQALKTTRFAIRFQTAREGVEAAAAICAMGTTLCELGVCVIDESPSGILECVYLGTQTQAELTDLFAFIIMEGDQLTIEEAPQEGAAPDQFGFFEDASATGEEFGFFEPIETSAVTGLASAPKNGEAATVRVKLAKIDTLINLVGELLIAQSSVQERALRLDPAEHAELHASIAELQRHTRDIRESVMSVRMLPIGSIFNRFPRMVRELAAQLGKTVVFESTGGETELDKGLIESIIDPLTHIIRNSLDHGIESTAQRIAAGKPAQGAISIRSFQRGGNVVIEVRDDGAGMDRERILAKAQLLGLRVREHMSDKEVWALVCTPGFSTAEEVTDVSGRGVGMDVVKRNILSLGGTVAIDSVTGRGTTISLILPLTLAILDGLAVRIGNDVCIVPMMSIMESIPIARRDIVHPPDSASFILYRGEPLPLIAAPGCTTMVSEEQDRIAVVIEADGRSAGLLVDSLESEHQVVIKSLEKNFRKVEGFSGATILGNGNVALILDVATLVAG